MQNHHKIDVCMPMKFPDSIPINRVVVSTKKGLANARNDLMARVETPWFLFIDSDILLNEDWWNKIKVYMDDSEVGAVNGQGPPSGFILKWIRKLLLLRGTVQQRGFTSNTLIRKKAVEGITLTRKGRLEDIELQEKIMARGWKWVILTNAYCRHTKSTMLVIKEAWQDFKTLWREKGLWHAIKSI